MHVGDLSSLGYLLKVVLEAIVWSKLTKEAMTTNDDRHGAT
jgi:hypothetical protein